jgi:ADP-ribose pyrophosphatase YjhB (NUDIX family)
MNVTQIDDGSTFLYLDQAQVEHVGNIKKDSYQEAVRQLPIPCVDTFLFNPRNRSYFLVLRKDPPAKGVWWLPGGRLQKGENFFTCSIRKCKEEAGLEVSAVKHLGCFATIFPDSMWSTQTHSINTIVLSILNDKMQQPIIDNTCDNYKWVSIDSKPEDPYVAEIYLKAIKKLNKLKLL